MGGGGYRPPERVENPYDDTWIHSKFSEGNQRARDIENWMNERKAALQQPTYYTMPDGTSVKQSDWGTWTSSKFEDQMKLYDQKLADLQQGWQDNRRQQRDIYDARLADINAAVGGNAAALEQQGRDLARQGQRSRQAYGTGGLNRGSMRIQGVNV